MVLIAAVILAIAGAVMGYSTAMHEDVRGILAANILVTNILNVAAAIIFFMALPGFRLRLRRAYYFVCIAALGSAAVTGGYLIAALFVSSDAWWINSYVYMVPYGVVVLSLFIAASIIARAVGYSSVLLRPYVSLPIVIAGAILWGFSSNISAVPGDYPIRPFDYTLVVDGCMSLGMLIVAYLFWGIRSNVSKSYAQSLLWLVIWAGGISVMVIFGSSVPYLFTTFDNWYFANDIQAVPTTLAAILASIAAMQFYCVSFVEKHVEKLEASGRKATSIDIVVSLAELASKPQEIDTVAEELRYITAALPSYDAKLGDEQQEKLGLLYLKIEDYLVNSDPVRQYKQHELREMIDLRFSSDVNEPVFWKTIGLEKPTQISV